MANPGKTVKILWRGVGPMIFEFGGSVERDAIGNAKKTVPPDAIRLDAPRNPVREAPQHTDVSAAVWERAKADPHVGPLIAHYVGAGSLIVAG